MSIAVEILTPSRPVANFVAEMVGAPGAFGYMGIGKDHAPMASELRPGVLSVKLKKETSDSTESNVFYFIRGGYLEVQKNRVLVLADGLETPQQIDQERAKEAEKRALDRLYRREDAATLDLNLSRALASLERARARLRLAQNEKTNSQP